VLRLCAASLGVDHSLKRASIVKYQGRSFYLHQLLLFKIREQAADGLARSSNHLGYLLVSEGEFYLRLLVRLQLFRIPREQELG